MFVQDKQRHTNTKLVLFSRRSREVGVIYISISFTNIKYQSREDKVLQVGILGKNTCTKLNYSHQFYMYEKEGKNKIKVHFITIYYTYPTYSKPFISLHIDSLGKRKRNRDFILILFKPYTFQTTCLVSIFQFFFLILAS